MEPTSSPQPQITQNSAPSAPPEIRLWNPNAAANWSLLLSPLFGQILHYKNWRVLGDNSKARQSLIWIGATIAAWIAAFIIPIEGMKGVVALGALLGWYFVLARKQIALVKSRFGSTYTRRSFLLPLGIAVLIWVAFFAVVSVAALVEIAAKTQPTTQEQPVAQEESATSQGPTTTQIRAALEKANMPDSGRITQGHMFVADGSGLFPSGAEVYPTKIEGFPFTLYFVQDHFDNWRFLWEEMQNPQLLPAQIE